MLAEHCEGVGEEWSDAGDGLTAQIALFGKLKGFKKSLAREENRTSRVRSDPQFHRI
jgi:hypothetical protein